MSTHCDPRWPTVFIDRHYNDAFDTEPPWPRRRRWPEDPGEWQATCEYGTDAESEWFDDLDEALSWARTRAARIFVRLGATKDTYYSAGTEALYESVDESGRPYPDWPPDHWPYEGPHREPRALSSDG